MIPLFPDKIWSKMLWSQTPTKCSQKTEQINYAKEPQHNNEISNNTMWFQKERRENENRSDRITTEALIWPLKVKVPRTWLPE
jgi:hypothetical protein